MYVTKNSADLVGKETFFRFQLSYLCKRKENLFKIIQLTPGQCSGVVVTHFTES